MFKKMMLSTMSLDCLFLSLLISRQAAEKICSDGMDVGTARKRLTIIEIIKYFKLQNCLFCCGVANIIVYLRRVNDLKTDV